MPRQGYGDETAYLQAPCRGCGWRGKRWRPKKGPAGEIADSGFRSAGAASTTAFAVVGRSVTADMPAVSLLLRQGLTGRYGVGKYGPAAKWMAAKGSRPAGWPVAISWARELRQPQYLL